MGYQTAVNSIIAGAIPGELFREGPLRARELILNSGSAANNIVGSTYFTESPQGYAVAGGTGAMAGVLANPKEYANLGAAGNTLGANNVLPNGINADFVSLGIIAIAFSEAFTIGQPVCYDTATGKIHAGAPSTGQLAIPNATIVEFTSSVAGTGVIALTN